MMNKDLQFRRRIQGVMRKYAREGERFIGGCCGVCSPRGGCCPACRGGGVVGGCCSLCRGGNFYQGGISADVWDELDDDDKRTLRAAQKMAILFLKSGKAVGDTIRLLRGIADYARIDTYSLVSSLEAIVRFARATYIPSLQDLVKRAGLTKLVEKIDDLIAKLDEIISSPQYNEVKDPLTYRVYEENGELIDDHDGKLEAREFPDDLNDIYMITQKHINDMDAFLKRRKTTSSSGTSDKSDQLVEQAENVAQQLQQAVDNNDAQTVQVATAELEMVAVQATTNAADAQVDTEIARINGPNEGETDNEFFDRLDRISAMAVDAATAADAIATIVGSVNNGTLTLPTRPAGPRPIPIDLLVEMFTSPSSNPVNVDDVDNIFDDEDFSVSERMEANAREAADAAREAADNTQGVNRRQRITRQMRTRADVPSFIDIVPTTKATALAKEILEEEARRKQAERDAKLTAVYGRTEPRLTSSANEAVRWMRRGPKYTSTVFEDIAPVSSSRSIASEISKKDAARLAADVAVVESEMNDTQMAFLANCKENWRELGLKGPGDCDKIFGKPSKRKSKASIEDSAMSKKSGLTWIEHVKAYAKKNKVTYSEAMSLAAPSWRGCKKLRPCPARKKVCKKTPCATKRPTQRWAKPAATKRRAASGSKTAAKKRTAKKKAPARKRRGGGMVQ